VSVRRIRVYGDPVLREKAREVEEIDEAVRAVAQDLLDTLREGEDGVGLAATQIGEDVRVIAVAAPDEAGKRTAARALVNPRVVEKGGRILAEEEGCLSVPGLYEVVKRPERIRVRALTLEGEEIDEEHTGMAARVFLHEVDHLDGVLFVDRVSPLRRALIKKRLRAFLD
jgi:peptide deformylase